jgi:hypothetical protein
LWRRRRLTHGAATPPHEEGRVLKVKLEKDTIRIGKHFGVSFQRTLRIPDDGNI